ncbi:NAD-dependent malic enzyme [Planococcus sp. CP5-4]|uniref:NAD(P)-dependent malic enzyme n=1 Tax=unclassified Planococcus (in: firmicutes) TaxID=2662419 RepID=UPI001C216889|nr:MULTISPECIES: malic enzyme-like NAD(P)-binding protein [unclassified Planococcus (in: firmicutes)]MBU9673667.1 NAD-dependent malic enzyme [Planococcus sp. CP5-4_YE]MBV0907957.1 NAD-dependent malic enzyme [Planococcus sp. CP5-4_UN]MBW6063124.1 NAD-dependent malic enzyme [Planococcus sp. CP5-4]
MTDLKNDSLNLHRRHQGKLEIRSKVAVENERDLSLAYSPGVAAPCREIHADPSKVHEYTMKGNTVAVITDGTAVLGLGNIGPQAALPVMEGKALLFKEFAGVDAFPICLDTTDAEEIIRTVKLLEPGFGGVNLEDIAAPTCFIVEQRLKKEMNIPVFHDDQHGTAIVTLAGLINSLKLVEKEIEDVKVVVNGAGAAGIAIVKLLSKFGFGHIVMCDTKGAIYNGRPNGMNPFKAEVAEMSNYYMEQGQLADVIAGADVFVGVSAEGALTESMVRSMNEDPVIFAMANPNPEILPHAAKSAGARVIGTGRSDFANQVNNVLAFPGLFRGALDVQASDINDAMKIAAVEAIAALIATHELHEDYVIPKPFDPRVAQAVAEAVARAAGETGVAKVSLKEPAQQIVL